MKRNWYAVILLVLLSLSLMVGGWYVTEKTEQMARNIEYAFSCTTRGDFPAARRAYEEVNAQAKHCAPYFVLLLRRNLVDQLGQTLATLPEYAAPDNLADLAVESARATAQIEQLRKSYLFVP